MPTGIWLIFETAGIKYRPAVVTCGGRNNAFDSYCTAIKNGETAMLLVDSEEAVNQMDQRGDPDQWNPINHLSRRDGWHFPASANNNDCHLMVQCMEAWLIADHQTLAEFFNRDFKKSKLPNSANALESVTRQQLYQALAEATRKCQKGPYGKGAHSFKLLGKIDPQIISTACPWAKRFLDTLKKPHAMIGR